VGRLIRGVKRLRTTREKIQNVQRKGRKERSKKKKKKGNVANPLPPDLGNMVQKGKFGGQLKKGERKDKDYIGERQAPQPPWKLQKRKKKKKRESPDFTHKVESQKGFKSNSLSVKMD